MMETDKREDLKEQKEVVKGNKPDYPDVEEDDNYSAPVVLAYDGED